MGVTNCHIFACTRLRVVLPSSSQPESNARFPASLVEQAGKGGGLNPVGRRINQAITSHSSGARATNFFNSHWLTSLVGQTTPVLHRRAPTSAPVPRSEPGHCIETFAQRRLAQQRALVPEHGGCRPVCRLQFGPRQSAVGSRYRPMM